MARLTIREANAQALERQKAWKGINPYLKYTFFIFLTMIFIISVYVSLQSPVIQRFDILQKGFTILSTFLIVYVLFLNVESKTRQEESKTRQDDLNISEQLYYRIIREMDNKYPESYFIYNEIEHFDDRTTEELEKVIKYDPEKRKAVENYFSQLIIGSFENLITMNKYIVGDIGWWASYYDILQSPIIQKKWKSVGPYYSPVTRNLIDAFIEIGKDTSLTYEQINEKIENLYVD